MRFWRLFSLSLGAFLLTTAVAGVRAARADGVGTPPSLSFWGVPGLIDMPSAETGPDGEVTASVSSFAGISRGVLGFQITPWMSGTFRYSSMRRFNTSFPTTYYDRSFDLRFHLVDEGRYVPSVTLGLQDFIGTDLMSAEYLVATKYVTPALALTLGLGWGRLGSYGSIGSTFGTRAAHGGLTSTGQPNVKQWFHGPVAPFGGLAWQVNDRLTFKAEYSSDAYVQETGKALLDRRSPINLGVEYALTPSTRIGVYELYGAKIGVSLQVSTDPATRPNSLMGPAPVPVAVRPPEAANPDAWSPDWVRQPDAVTILRDNVARQLKSQGLELDALAVTPDTAELRIINPVYDSGAQAIGRAARVLSQTMPASVETFKIVPMANGMPVSQVTIRRTDLERYEFAPNGDLLLRGHSDLGLPDPLPATAARGVGLYPKLSWALTPYSRISIFDPDNPLRADFGLRLSGSYTLAQGLILSGSVTKKAFGNLDQTTRASNSQLPHVRSDFARYNAEGDPALESLQLAWYTRPGPNLFGRVTAGYLEQMYGGVSAELLWQPPTSTLALGMEVDYVKQRAFNDRLGFQSYSVGTGMVSAYYTFGGGYFARIDAGRYLARDVGATLTLSREFANGWTIGAFATKTNVSAAKFGEGSFDKGIFFRIPLNWLLGVPTQSAIGTVIRPVQRDGGQMLNVNGRLYDVVRQYQSGDLDGEWGRVFR